MPRVIQQFVEELLVEAQSHLALIKAAKHVLAVTDEHKPPIGSYPDLDRALNELRSTLAQEI